MHGKSQAHCRQKRPQHHHRRWHLLEADSNISRRLENCCKNVARGLRRRCLPSAVSQVADESGPQGKAKCSKRIKQQRKMGHKQVIPQYTFSSGLPPVGALPDAEETSPAKCCKKRRCAQHSRLEFNTAREIDNSNWSKLHYNLQHP